jgi:phenylpropionate dioxygenase-like ring-hydroxylating dioxygenase large terminal subunit
VTVELTQLDLRHALTFFWHPVCTLAELTGAPKSVLGVRLLGRDLAVAALPDGTFTALDDRCPHRSTRLSVGCAELGGIRCAYHGWKWNADGRCVEIPAMPDGPIPSKAVVGAYAIQVAYDIVWVCLDTRAAAELPACPAWTDRTMRVVPGVPYTWPTAAPRRVENFVDLSHFAWVHDGSLGRRDEPVPPLPSIERAAGELRFVYDPPDIGPDASAMFGFSSYRLPMPCTVNIEFEMAGGVRRTLWMTASPIEDGVSRAFWFMCRSDDLDGPDEPHIAFQRLVLDEDEPVVCNQVPTEMPMDLGAELSVRTDRVSIEYRRWLREIVTAAALGPEQLRACLERAAVPGAVGS